MNLYGKIFPFGKNYTCGLILEVNVGACSFRNLTMHVGLEGSTVDWGLDMPD